jgi:RHS repeat-associated protein
LNEYDFGYNNANQIISITEPTVRTRTFGYDNADRLTLATSTLPNQNENYSFDDVGNRTSSHLSSSYGYQQGAFNRLTATQTATYSFDANGNVTSKSEGTSKWYYSYDYENRLTNATKFGGLMPRAGESINYHYDALGRRVVRQDKKTGRTEFTHDGMDVIQDRFNKSDGTTSTTNYVNGLGVDDKLKVTSGSTSKYFLTDHLGSTVGLSDTNSNVTESATHDSFGRIQSSNLSTRYQYTGRESDETTGLMYYRARQYDPQVGRFTSEDPIGFAGGDVNLYGYVWNNPLNYIDPFGQDGFPPVIPKRKKRGGGHRPKPRRIIEPPPAIEEPPPPQPPPPIDPPPTPTPTPPTYPPPPPTPPSNGDCGCETAIPRFPDFISLSGSVPFMPPAGPFAGVTGSVTLDRNGNVYLAAGSLVGYPSAGGISITGGWLNQRCKPTPTQLNNFLTGWAVTGGIGLPAWPFPLHIAESWSPGNGAATQIGTSTFGVAGSVTGGWNLGSTGLGW